MLRPKANDRNLQILSGKDLHSFFGKYLEPPKRCRRRGTSGQRILFSPKNKQANDIFLSVLMMSDEAAPEIPIDLEDLPNAFVLTIADRVVVLSKSGKLFQQPFSVKVKTEMNCQLLLTALTPGDWSIYRRDGTVEFNTHVDQGRNTAFFRVPQGDYTVLPKALSSALE